MRGLGGDLQCLLAGAVLAVATYVLAVLFDVIVGVLPAPRLAGHPLADLIGFATLPAALGVLMIRAVQCVIRTTRP